MSVLAPPSEFEEQLPRRRWTRAEYYLLADTGILSPDERVELIEGEILIKTPQTPQHAVVTQLVRKILTVSLGDEYFVSTRLPLTIDDECEPEPDGYVTTADIDRFTDSHPTPADVVLVVEVSDSSLAFDRGQEARLYARGGVQDYWIVNLVDRRVEVMSGPFVDIGYRTTTIYLAGDSIQPPVLGAHRIAVNDLLP